jgi:hypothetical protein
LSYPYKKAFRLTDIYRIHWGEYIGSPSRNLKLEGKHFKAVNYSLACRTSKMGYHYFKCGGCGHQHYLYHSCKHRFCGSCGSAETHRWAEEQLGNLLEMKHHHVVFTLPAALRGLCKANGKALYNLLFQSGQSALQDWFSAKHGIKCGIVSVLHTGGSDLKYHPHVHLIVSGGGLNPGTGEWKELEGDYLVNHKHLRKEFRSNFLEGLKRLHRGPGLKLTGRAALGFGEFIDKLSEQDWIVSVQPPLHDRAHIMKYIGRYTKRACLSEYRLQSVDRGVVRFTFKDYRNSERGGPVKEGVKQLDVPSFLDRLLQHVPDTGFRMVRYYGLYSNRYRSLRGSSKKQQEGETRAEEPFGQHEEYWQEVYGEEALRCKECQRPYTYYGQFFPHRSLKKIKPAYEHQDSS